MFNLLDNTETYDFMSNMAGTDDKDQLTQLLEAVGVANSRLADTSQAVKEVIAEGQQAQENLKAATQAEGDNSLILQEAQQRNALDVQSKTINLATKMGAVPEESGEILSQLAESKREVILDYDAKRKALKSAMDKKFTDGPIDYIIAQFQIEGLAAEADVAAKAVVGIHTAIQTVQQDVDAFGRIANGTAKAITDTTIQATLGKTKAAIDQAVSKVDIQNAQWNLQGIQNLNALDTQGLNLKQTEYNAIKQDEQLEMARKQLRLSAAAQAQAFEERKERLELQKASREEQEAMVNTMRVGLAAHGFASSTSLPAAKILQMLKMPEYHAMYKSGMYAEAMGQASGKTSQIIGLSPEETVKNVMASNSPMTPIQQQSVRPLIFGVISQVMDPAARVKNGLSENAKIDEIARVAGKQLVAVANGMQSEIRTGDASNIYAAPEMKVLVSIPAVANTPFYQKVIAPQVAAGGLKAVDPEVMVGLTLGAIKNGTISFNDAAAGMQAFFAGAKEYNNAYKNFAGLALPMQKTFNARVGTGMRTRMYDLTKAKDIGNLLTATMVQGEMLERSQIKTGFFD